MTNTQIKNSITAVAVATLLAACGGDNTSTATTVSGTTSGNAVLSIDLVDAPVDLAAHVYVNITGLELQGPQARQSYVYCLDESTETDADADATVTAPESLEMLVIPDPGPNEVPDDDTDLDDANHGMQEHSSGQPACSEPETRTIDLLALTDGAAERLLDDVVIPAGKYQWIRLQLADNPGTLVLDDGQEHELVIPSGNQTGLKLTGGFDAFSNAQNHLVLDFDLRKSVVKAGNKYLLKPVIKMIRVDNAETQNLSGSWAHTDAVDCVAPMVYLFEGSDVAPDDIDGNEIEPVASVEMTATEDGLGWIWTAPWLTPADYTVAYTCNGDTDEAESDDSIIFQHQFNETVTGD